MRGREPTGANVLAFSPDGKTLVSDCDGNFIKLWATDTGEEILPKAGHESTVRCIAFSPDGRLIFSGGDDDTVRVWNAFTDRQIRRLREDPFDYSGRRMLLAISSLASSPSQQFLAGGSWGRVFLLGARTGTPTEVWSVPVEEYIQHIGFSSDGTTLAWGSDTESVYVVDVRPGAAPRNVVGAKAEGVGRRAPGFVLALSPDGKRLLYGQKSAPYICREVATGKELYKLAAPAVGLRDVSFLPDGKSLISVNVDDTIAVWDGSNGKELRSSKHGRNVRAARLSPDGKTLAIGNGDGTISLWDVNAGRERHQFAGHQAGVCCVAFAPNGKVLASGSEDGTVLVWDVEDPLGTKRPASADVDVLWDTLGGDDMAAVHRSIAALTTAARARPSLILERVRPMIRPEEGKCARLVALLDDERFETREKATTELAKLADLAEPALRRALAERPSPEVRQAVERLLIGLEEPGFSTRECRLQRAVEILERVGTDEARRALEEISKGAPGRWLRQLAKAAQARLEKR